MLYFNGIDQHGRYLTPPVSAGEFLERLTESSRLAQFHQLLPERSENGAELPAHPSDLGMTGWAAIFAAGRDPRIQIALQPLLEHRRAQASRRAQKSYRELVYHPGESTIGFLARQGARPGRCNPDLLPFYLLLVGGPEELPYELQSELGINYGVGRICFEQIEDYAAYAHHVVEAETWPPESRREVAFFAPRHLNDPVTDHSATGLILPLSEQVATSGMNWQVLGAVGSEARKERLRSLLGAADRPALLFTACHGIGFPGNDPRHRGLQGSLVCQDWPGPNEEVSADQIFSANDIPEDASLRGLVAFLLASGSAGRSDTFPGGSPPSVAALPQRLLAKGATAVVGHAGQTGVMTDWERRAFSYSLGSVLSGDPIGWTLGAIHQTSAKLIADALQVGDSRQSAPPHAEKLAELWRTIEGLRGLVLLGDPAVRLPGSHIGEAATRSPASRGFLDVRGIGGALSSPPRKRGLVSGDRSKPPVPAVPPEPQPQDPFHFSAYTPELCTPETWYSLLAYCFRKSAALAVEEDSARRLATESSLFLPTDPFVATAATRDSEILIIPELAGCRFNPPQVSFFLLEDWHRAEVRFQPLRGLPGFALESDLPGRISFYVDSVLAADIPFMVRLTRTAGPERGRGEIRLRKAQPYQAVFISYSRADVAVVEVLERTYSALGLTALRDLHFLRTGEEWAPKLLEKIEAADIFQLFWSRTAQESEHVQAEWRHALRMRRNGFIRPVFWEKPMPSPPEELAKLHFHRLRLDG